MGDDCASTADTVGSAVLFGIGVFLYPRIHRVVLGANRWLYSAVPTPSPPVPVPSAIPPTPAKPLSRQEKTEQTVDLSRRPGFSTVLYVRKRNAKWLKDQIEGTEFLNRTFRMCSADPASAPPSLVNEIQDMIAVPVSDECVDTLKILSSGKSDVGNTWPAVVEGVGAQAVMYSSSAWGQLAGMAGPRQRGNRRAP